MNRVSTKRFSASALSLVAAGGLLLSLSSPALATAAEEKWYVIKVHINIYKMAGMSKDDAKAAVKKANEILKQAMVRLDLTDKCIKENLDQPGGDDGSLTENERKQVRKDGAKEVAGADGKGKGVKLAFVKQPKAENANTNGLAVKCDPTAIVRKNPTNADRTGETCAHEICHILGLPHHTTSNDNLMTTSKVPRTDTKLTADQIAIVKKKAEKFGEETKKKKGGDGSTPSSKTPSEHGAKAATGTNPLRGGDPYQNIGFARMSSLFGESDYEVSFELDGLVPDSPFGSTDYLMLFNTDNNAGTGEFLHGRAGVDRVVRARVHDPSNIEYFIENADGSGQMPLVGSFERMDEDVELAEPGPEDPIPSNDFLNLKIPHSALSFTNGDVFDVGLVAVDQSMNITDDLTMRFDRIAHTRGPGLLTDRGTYEPGETMTLQGSGFMPFEPLELLLDDTSLGIINADEFGLFTTFVNAPMGLDPDFYFLSAHPLGFGDLRGGESSSESGVTVVNIPTPGSIMLAIIGLGLATRRRRS